MTERVSFPRQQARTRRFTLGQPRGLHVASDGSRVVFLRSPGGDDPETALWAFDVSTSTERLLADARALLAGSTGDVPPEERARRERVREMAGGIVAYSADPPATRAAFSLAGRAFVADLGGGASATELPAAGPVVDPRLDPTASRVAYVTAGALHVAVPGGADEAVIAEDGPDVRWGLAEFVAAEEMGRTRGFWWAPDGRSIAAARVDVGPVGVWHIADPSEPDRPPTAVRYPGAGTANADVSLSVFDLRGGRTDVDWDRDAFPYLARVVWTQGHPLTLLLQSRDQRTVRFVTVDEGTGRTTTVREHRRDPWVEIVDGVPAWLDGGELVWVGEDADTDTRRLFVDDRPVTPAGVQVRGVIHTGAEVVFTASEEPTAIHVWRASADGAARVTSDDGVHGAAAGGDLLVLASSSLERDGLTTTVWRGDERIGELRSFAETPDIELRLRLVSLGRRELRSALLLPGDAADGVPLPVLLDPYGGPHAQRVLRARAAYGTSQWFADQGFAVLVADGRGTPGRGLAWEEAVAGDLATPALEDQVEALHAAAELDARLDLSRVAIRGWSFGGYLAALAVLRRPDVLHAAVVGAPVTDWRLYDTHYTERYLGDPQAEPDQYRMSSLMEDAPKLERPMLLIHGLADDNVVVAHTLRLSRALLEAGRPHAVLPLCGVTHMTSQESVAENLLLLQVAFLRQALGLPEPTP